MELESTWEMILHHLEAASSYAEEAALSGLQQKIDALKEEAELAVETARRNATDGRGRRS